MKSLPNYLKRSTDVWDVNVDSIIVPAGRRTAGDDLLFEQSIEKLGLIQPIILAPDLTLICGARRLDQYKRLGKKTIPAHFKNYDEIERELAELEENLTHAPYSYLERIKQLKRHKELYEAKYPEARHGNTKERVMVKRQDGVLPSSFTEIAGTTSRKSQRTIQRDIKLAGEISDEACEVLLKTRLANKPKELARLAKHDDETQLKLVNEIKNWRANDVRRAEANTSIRAAGAEASHKEFDSRIRSIWFELDQANQNSEFQKMVDRSHPNTHETVERMQGIQDFLCNWLQYYHRRERPLQDAA